MADSLRAWAKNYVRTHRPRPAPPNFKPPAKAVRPGRAADPNLGHRLASEPHLLERLAAVQPDTVAVVLPSDQPPAVKRPGEQLRPSLLAGRRPSYVVVVSTLVTRLDVLINQLITLDGHAVQQIRIRVGVHVTDRDGYRGLISAVLLHHPDLDSYLLQCVQRELAAKLKVAVGMNRLAELQRKTLQQVLTSGWFPESFADGVLVPDTFAVLETRWPTVDPAPTETDEPPAYEPYRRPRPELTLAPGPGSGLDLTMDARLRRLWTTHADLELLGIAGAKVRDGTTVIAVPAREPGAYEGSRLREAFEDYYHDHQVRLVSAVGNSYDDLVRAWFRQVDSWPRRLVSITATADDTLQIHIDQDRLPPEDRSAGVTVGRESDREALQNLLPHDRVEFVPADVR